MKYRLLVWPALILLVITISQSTKANTPYGKTQIAQLTFDAKDIQPVDQTLTITPAGLTLTDGFETGDTIMPAIKSPLPFNAVVPEWQATLPEGSTLSLLVRTSKDGLHWNDWYESQANMDWTVPEKEITVGDMIFLPTQDGKHEYIEVKISLKRQVGGGSPVFYKLQLSFIDSTNGPTAAELAAQQEALNASQSSARNSSPEEYPKPSVISREVWCLEEGCNYSEGLEYQPVTHLILHHTVTSVGGNGDSAAIVRAIWRYHTFENEWGDIGYNYLVDIDGNIYEGHLGGDDVVGIHAGKANTGSMGLAMIGDFRSESMPEPMREAIIDIFAWKADQRNIDLFNASNSLPNVDYGLPNLMGHRDVAGDTECPGDYGHSLLPAIRDETAARLGLVSPHLYIDELSSAFTKSNNIWGEPPLQCGHNTHSWYTWSEIDAAQALNWGEWRPDVPTNGRYQIDVFIPYCYTGAWETAGAKYTVQHANGNSDVVVDQNTNVGLWTSLGDYDLHAGYGNAIRLTDLTTIDEDMGIWFDAMRLLPLVVYPTATNGQPMNNDWSNQLLVAFNWTITEPENVTKTVHQVATDAEFTSLLVDEYWATAVYSNSHTFEQDYDDLYWRIQLTTESGAQFNSTPARFGIDSTLPTSTITHASYLTWSDSYILYWQGSDQLSGIAEYNIEYRPVISGTAGTWLPWLSNTAANQATFQPLDSGGTYEFRSQAKDIAGNIEATHSSADISTAQAIHLSRAIMLPTILR